MLDSPTRLSTGPALAGLHRRSRQSSRRHAPLGPNVGLRDALTDRVLPFNSDAPDAYAAVAVVRRLTAPPAAPANRQITANRGVPHAVECGPNARTFENMGKGIMHPTAGT